MAGKARPKADTSSLLLELPEAALAVVVTLLGRQASRLALTCKDLRRAVYAEVREVRLHSCLRGAKRLANSQRDVWLVATSIIAAWAAMHASVKCHPVILATPSCTIRAAPSL
jgi:hypothetical protein